MKKYILLFLFPVFTQAQSIDEAVKKIVSESVSVQVKKSMDEFSTRFRYEDTFNISVNGTNIIADTLLIPEGKTTAIFVLNAKAVNGTSVRTAKKEVVVKQINGAYTIVTDSNIRAMGGDVGTANWNVFTTVGRYVVIRLSGTALFTLSKQIIL